MKWWPCMMKRKREPEPHLKLFRLSWGKTRQEKISTVVRYFSYFWCRILRSCGVCDAFAVFLSEPVAQWLSRRDLNPAFLLFPVTGHSLSFPGRAGPRELSGLVLAPLVGISVPASSSLLPVASPAVALALQVPELGRAGSPGVLEHLSSRVSGCRREHPPSPPQPWLHGPAQLPGTPAQVTLVFV